MSGSNWTPTSRGRPPFTSQEPVLSREASGRLVVDLSPSGGAPPTPTGGTNLPQPSTEGRTKLPRLNLLVDSFGQSMAEGGQGYGEIPPEEDFDGPDDGLVSQGALAHLLKALGQMQAETAQKIHQETLISIEKMMSLRAREFSAQSDRRGFTFPPPDKFNGVGLREWIRGMEAHMMDNNVPREKWSLLAAAHLTGEARSHWAGCRDNQTDGTEPTWNEMVNELHRRFCDVPPSEIKDMLRAIGWEGSIAKLSSRFNAVLAKGENPPQREIIDIYLGRLPVELVMAVRAKNVESWSQLQQYLMREDNITRTLLQRWKAEALPEHLRTAETTNPYWKPMLSGPKQKSTWSHASEEGRRPPPKQQMVAQPREGNTSRHEGNVHVKGGGVRTPVRPQNPSAEKCSICNGAGHVAKWCANRNDAKTKDSSCHKCGGYGHWAKDCASRGKEPRFKQEESLNGNAREEKGNPSGNATQT